MTGARSAERVRVDAVVKIHGADDEAVFRTRDLSEHGLFLYTQVTSAYSFKVGSTLDIELLDTDESFSFTVVVARIVEPNSTEAESFPTGFGVKILEISDESRAKLDAMIARIKAAG